MDSDRLVPLALASCLLPLVLVAPASGRDTVILSASRDNTLYGEGGLSNAIGEHVFTGVTAQSAIRRALLLFDVAGQVPAGATITTASLQLFMSITQAGPEEVSMHRLQADWGEGTSNAPGEEGAGTAATTGDATWNFRFFPATPWSAPGGDFDTTASAAVSVNQVGFYTWGGPGLVADVQQWLNAPSTNFGWLLRQNELADTTAKRFESRENPVGSRVPMLTIEYSLGGCSGTVTCNSTPNSTGSVATILANGSCTVADNNFGLSAGPVPDQDFGQFFFSASVQNQTFGNGVLCVGGCGNEMFRLPVLQSVAGQFNYQLDFGVLPASGLLLPGSTWNFQLLFRDRLAGGAFFDLSNSLKVTFH